MRPLISTAPSFCNLAVYINHLRITEMEKYEIFSCNGLVFFFFSYLMDHVSISFSLKGSEISVDWFYHPMDKERRKSAYNMIYYTRVDFVVLSSAWIFPWQWKHQHHKSIIESYQHLIYFCVRVSCVWKRLSVEIWHMTNILFSCDDNVKNIMIDDFVNFSRA